MSIDTLALLRIPGWRPDPDLHAIALDDAFLVPAGGSYASEPDEIGLALRTRLGDIVEKHADPRGIFCIPDVATPSATTYDALVDEIGEAGIWAPVVPSGYVPERLRDAPAGSFEALAGQIMGAMGQGTMEELQRAMMSGDAEAFARAQERMMEDLSKMGDPQEIAQKLMAALPNEEDMAVEMGRRVAGAGSLPVDMGAIDLESADFQALVRQAEEDLAMDPERRARLEELMRQMRGGEPAGDDEDDDDGR